jgi:hypothetical protein
MISIKDLKYLTDENIDVELLEFLREQGFDVFDIKEDYFRDRSCSFFTFFDCW